MEYQGIKLNDGKFIETTVCYLIDGNKVLLGERLNPETGLGKDKFAGIGGKLEEGETYDDANKREVREEINVSLKSYVFVGVIEWLYPSGVRENMRSIAYISTEWEGEPQETKFADPVWFEFESIPLERMFHDNRFSVPRILSGEKIYAVFTYDDEGKKVINVDIKPLKEE